MQTAQGFNPETGNEAAVSITQPSAFIVRLDYDDPRTGEVKRFFRTSDPVNVKTALVRQRHKAARFATAEEAEAERSKTAEFWSVGVPLYGRRDDNRRGRGRCYVEEACLEVEARS